MRQKTVSLFVEIMAYIRFEAHPLFNQHPLSSLHPYHMVSNRNFVKVQMKDQENVVKFNFCRIKATCIKRDKLIMVSCYIKKLISPWVKWVIPLFRLAFNYTRRVSQGTMVNPLSGFAADQAGSYGTKWHRAAPYIWSSYLHKLSIWRWGQKNITWSYWMVTSALSRHDPEPLCIKV